MSHVVSMTRDERPAAEPGFHAPRWVDGVAECDTPDQSLGRRVREILRHSPYRRLHLVSTDVRNGIAVLTGRVPSFYVKQMAQCLLAEVEGLRRIDNRLEVAE